MPTPTTGAPTKRLGLGHLILWVTCCAVYLGLARGLLEPERIVTATQLLAFSAITAFNGFAWAAAAVVLFRRLGSARTTTEPGEWAVCTVGLILAVDVCTRLLPEQFIIRQEAVRMAGTCAALVLPTLSRRLVTTWKIFFMLMVALYAVPLCAVLSDAFGLWPRAWPLARFLINWQQMRPAVALCSVAAFVIIDRRAGRQGSWSHWLGIGCTVIWILTTWRHV